MLLRIWLFTLNGCSSSIYLPHSSRSPLPNPISLPPSFLFPHNLAERRGDFEIWLYALNWWSANYTFPFYPAHHFAASFPPLQHCRIKRPYWNLVIYFDLVVSKHTSPTPLSPSLTLSLSALFSLMRLRNQETVLNIGLYILNGWTALRNWEVFASSVSQHCIHTRGYLLPPSKFPTREFAIFHHTFRYPIILESTCNTTKHSYGIQCYLGIEYEILVCSF